MQIKTKINRGGVIGVLLFCAVLSPTRLAEGSTPQPWSVSFSLGQLADGDRALSVHLLYDYPHMAAGLAADERVDTVAELFSSDLEPIATTHAITELPKTQNATTIATLPVKLDKRGYLTGTVRLTFIVDDRTVVEAGEFAFWWHNDGASPRLISAREYNSHYLRKPKPQPPSTKNLEPGDVPGERVIRAGVRAEDVLKCGVNAVCPRRLQ